MIIQQFTDNDLYKFTTMYAIQKLYPHAKVKYKFFNRGNNEFPEGFAQELKKEVQQMANLVITQKECAFIEQRCNFFDPVFIDLLKGYRYDPREVKISQKEGQLYLTIEGNWYRTVLWEVPLMALISELYFKMAGQVARNVKKNAKRKAEELSKLKVIFSEFGTRRRFSFDVQDKVVRTLAENSGGFLSGSSNVFLAMKYQLTPIGTHPHEWFMYHAAHFGYKRANSEALKAWTEVYRGDLGIALTDTFTTDNFFEGFELQYAKLFDGLRWDSGDPIAFTQKALDYYTNKNIDSIAKTIVYSDSLNIETIKKIKAYASGRVKDVYGIGTYFSNDVGATPLNMVIKLTDAATSEDSGYYPTIKLSDVTGKNTGAKEEIELCRRILNIKD